jgi:hypothetical protein
VAASAIGNACYFSESDGWCAGLGGGVWQRSLLLRVFVEQVHIATANCHKYSMFQDNMAMTKRAFSLHPCDLPAPQVEQCRDCLAGAADAAGVVCDCGGGATSDGGVGWSAHAGDACNGCHVGGGDVGGGDVGGGDIEYHDDSNNNTNVGDDDNEEHPPLIMRALVHRAPIARAHLHDTP